MRAAHRPEEAVMGALHTEAYAADSPLQPMRDPGFRHVIRIGLKRNFGATRNLKIRMKRIPDRVEFGKREMGRRSASKIKRVETQKTINGARLCDFLF